MQQMIEGPQGRLAVLRAGPERAVRILFLHADPGCASQWGPVMDRIAADHSVIALDFRGAGRSDPARNGDYGIAGRVDDVAAVIAALGPGRIVIVTHSGGAAVGLEYAASHGGVAGILMVDPPTDQRTLPRDVRDRIMQDMAGPDSLSAFQSFVAGIAGDDPAVRRQVLADAAGLAPAARLGVSTALFDWQPDRALDAYRGPLFVLSTPASDTEGAIYRLRPDVPHRVVESGGHWLQLDRPDVVVEAVRDMLNRADVPE